MHRKNAPAKVIQHPKQFHLKLFNNTFHFNFPKKNILHYLESLCAPNKSEELNFLNNPGK